MADEIYKTIFQMDADNAKLLTALDEVNKKHVQTNTVIDDQRKKLQELEAFEQKLISARSKANNPTSVVKYNEKIAETKKAIASTTDEINKLTASEKGATKATQDFGKQMNTAFDATKVASMKTEIAQLGKQFEKTGNAIDEPIKKTISLKAQLRALKEQLANTDDEEEFLKLSIEAGKLEDKLGDARAAAQIFADDNPMLAFGNSIKGVAADLLSLNFADAAQKSKLLVDAGKQMTFASSVKGVKDLGVTLGNVGKALLTNPIFLIGAAVALIIANFSKLKNAGGLIGTIFIAIGRAIDVVIRAGKDLLDFIGLIDATKKTLEELIAFNDDLIASYQNYYKQRISILNSANKRVIELENEQAQKLLAVNKLQNEQILKDLNERGSSTEDYYEAIRKLMENGQKASDVFTQNQVRNNELEIKGLDKLRALQLQIADARQKNKEQQIGVNVAPGTPEAIKKLADLQISQTYRVQKEEQRAAAIELKDTEVVGKAQALIAAKYAQERILIKNKQIKDVLEAEKRLALEQLEITRTLNEQQVNIAQAQGTLNEEQVFEARVENLIEFYQAKEKLLLDNIEKEKALGFETVTSEKELNALKVKEAEDVIKAQDDLSKLRKNLRLQELDDETSHTLAMFDINKINETKISEILAQQGSRRTRIEIESAKKKLDILKKSGEATTAEIKKQENEITELEAKALEERKEERKQNVIAILDGIQQITDATFAAFNQQLAAQIALIDKQSQLQQSRIDEAKDIADKGNAELLELEKKRLDDLNKEKEKYVRRQQSLIALELVANSALAIAKAAAQGGIAAPFTIAATIIALVAGLAQAKSVAQQAAFYDGGLFEGYTGSGNPRDESTKGGRKPYVYHKEEFIFNHKTTAAYKDIFQDVHKGNIDLRDWQNKVSAFETLKNNPMAMVVNQNGDLVVLSGKMDKVISAIENQTTSLNLDGEGFSVYMKGITTRNDFIKNHLAKG